MEELELLQLLNLLQLLHVYMASGNDLSNLNIDIIARKIWLMRKTNKYWLCTVVIYKDGIDRTGIAEGK